MNAKRIFWMALPIVVLAAGVGAHALVDGTASPAALLEGYPDSRLLFKPADDPALPTFYAVPAANGGQCIVTSAGVLASCLPRDASLPGTVTVADDSEGDDLPPFAYGLVRPSVRAVAVVVKGVRHDAMLEGRFYLFKLPSATATVDDVDAVAFTLKDGRSVVRAVGG